MPDAIANSPDVPEKPFFRIGEVSRLTATKSFVLRYWETEFPMLQPAKGPNGQRMYRRQDIETVFEIKRLLYQDGFTIAGARKHLQEQNGGENIVAERKERPQSSSRPETHTRVSRKVLLDLHEELLGILTLLERK
ncbi:MAG: MerR family transcriptional regulator [Candidatus Acidiferrales bacterium]